MEATTETQGPQIAPEASASPAGFASILFPAGKPVPAAGPPACFRDTNLDQVVEAVVGVRDDHGLAPYFHTPLRSAGEVIYRQDVFRDLEDERLRGPMRAFTDGMGRVRAYLVLVEKQRHRLEQMRWLLDAAREYCAAVEALRGALAEVDLGSQGMRSFRAYLDSYLASGRFDALAGDARSVAAGLDRVRYTVRIKGGRVTVAGYEGEQDQTVEVERLFARFREDAAESRVFQLADPGSMGHVDAAIAERVARLFPAEFRALEAFCDRHAAFADPPITAFDREVRFYLAYLAHLERFGGLPVTYPEVAKDWGETAVEDGWDMALAATGRSSVCAPIVRNGFSLRGRERILVVTGPNQGGKTTFARMVGQLHYLASLGLPVPAARARLVLAEGVFTLFGGREDITTLRGRLDDELVHLKAILEGASDRSLILLNEVFASTTVADAVYLGREILARIVRAGCAAVWVTFVDELAAFGEEAVSMVAGVEPRDPTRRTFAITRRPPDGRAYAGAIAERYGLSADALRRRVDG